MITTIAPTTHLVLLDIPSPPLVRADWLRTNQRRGPEMVAGTRAGGRMAGMQWGRGGPWQHTATRMRPCGGMAGPVACASFPLNAPVSVKSALKAAPAGAAPGPADLRHRRHQPRRRGLTGMDGVIKGVSETFPTG
jgi:hypothetical protein